MSAPLDAYDELPYDDVPLRETDPEFLAARLRLAGFDAPDPSRARILELGCAGGANLLAIARSLPGAACVGVELSRVQAERARSLAAESGLSNVEILQADLAALPPLGRFDFVIAHGVYSWAPAPVREALLALCASVLGDHGLAYLSWNVLPGWRSRLALRRALLAAAGRGALRGRVARARMRLAELSAAPGALARYPDLDAEIAFLCRAGDAYLAHEYLAPINRPYTLRAFERSLRRHGLALAADACLPPEASSADAQRRDVEQAVRFRRSLLVRAQRCRGAVPGPEACAFHALLESDEEIDLEAPSVQRFRGLRGELFPVGEPLAKAALMVLSSAYPDALDFRTLVEAAFDLLRQFGSRAGDEQAMRGEWSALTDAGAVTPVAAARRLPCPLSTRPRAHALARAQAQAGSAAVAGAHLVALEIDEAGRHLLLGLDGTRDEAQLLARQRVWCDAHGVCLDDESLLSSLRAELQLFSRHALLAT